MPPSQGALDAAIDTIVAFMVSQSPAVPPGSVIVQASRRIELGLKTLRSSVDKDVAAVAEIVCAMIKQSPHFDIANMTHVTNVKQAVERICDAGDEGFARVQKTAVAFVLNDPKRNVFNMDKVTEVHAQLVLLLRDLGERRIRFSQAE